MVFCINQNTNIVCSSTYKRLPEVILMTKYVFTSIRL